MTKSSTPSSLKKINFDEDWDFHPLIQWLSHNKKILLLALFALITLLIIASWLISARHLNAERDFFQAQTAFSQFQQTAPTSSNETSSAPPYLEQLIALMQRYPELKPKYEGSLAQTTLIKGEISQAQLFIDDIFKRTPADHLKLYQNYTQTSVLISKGDYAEALSEAQQLKSTLDQINGETNPILYVFNLIRLAMLYQHMGQPEQELKTWEELQNQPQRLEAVLEANQIFTTGQASLNQYIEERKNVLK